MPTIRHCTLYQVINDTLGNPLGVSDSQHINEQPPTILYRGGITRSRAALRHETTEHLRRGASITSDANDRVTMSKGAETIEMWIDAEPAQKRAQGAGPKRKFSELTRHTVTLPTDMAAELERLGDGNLSAGIRRLLETR